MGQQVIKQPNGLYAIFDSISQTIDMWDATREEIIEEFVEAASTRARERAQQILHALDSNVPTAIYHQYAMAWEQAVELDRDNDGDYSKVKSCD